MEILLSGMFVFIFGAVIGSFLNVVILRFNTGRTIAGRSGCFSCGKKLLWYELIPIVSYLFLRGRCRACKSHISIQYPLVEAANGLVYLFLFFRICSGLSLENLTMIPVMLCVLSVILWSSLIVIFVYDIKHTIIPDLFSGIFFGCALCITALMAYQSHGVTMLFHHAIAGSIFGLLFFALWLVSKGSWMGFGDVKLVVSIGLYLGIAEGLSALAYAFWIGAVVALGRIGITKLMMLGTNKLSSGSKTLTMKSEVPFAPFLILGTLLALAFYSDIFHLTFLFNA